MMNDERRDDSEVLNAGETRTERSLESVIADCIERQENGASLRLHDVMDRFPQYATQLKSFFANQQWLRPDESPPEATLIGQRLDDEFELTRKIATGGMGVVYEAEQKSLRRRVAVKLIGDGVLADDELRMRFRIEAEAAAALSHPNILPIHAIGRWQGMDYFVMPLVSGRSLQADVLARRERLQQLGSATHGDLDLSSHRDAIHTAMTTARDIARGVAYAHRRGIIHRDLKPDNVLIDDDGQPKIVDFGLAKWQQEGSFAITRGPQLTQDGQVLGTPHYMSPEQARGESDVTAATDLYSTAGILFALLLGEPPNCGNTIAEVLADVLSDSPPSLRMRWPGGMPRIAELNDLERVLNRAMAPDRRDRYRSADDLADDLDRILRGERPRAAPDGLVSRFTRELTRDAHQTTFTNWGRALLRIGVVVLMAHIAMFMIAIRMPPEARMAMSLSALTSASLLGYFTPRLLMLCGIGWIIHRSRDGLWMPQGAAERPVWSIWLGYLATLTMVNLMWAVGYFDHESVLVLASLMSGFAFLAMAGHLWGGNVFLGLMFFVVTGFGVVWPDALPLLLGFAWMTAMWVLSRRYRGSQL